MEEYRLKGLTDCPSMSIADFDELVKEVERSNRTMQYWHRQYFFYFRVDTERKAGLDGMRLQSRLDVTEIQPSRIWGPAEREAHAHAVAIRDARDQVRLHGSQFRLSPNCRNRQNRMVL